MSAPTKTPTRRRRAKRVAGHYQCLHCIGKPCQDAEICGAFEAAIPPPVPPNGETIRAPGWSFYRWADPGSRRGLARAYRRGAAIRVRVKTPSEWVARRHMAERLLGVDLANVEAVPVTPADEVAR